MIEMNQSHWTEADRAEAVLRPVTSDLVAEKVRDMDGVHATDLYLRDGDEPEVYLAVAGGADERYVVFISRHNAEFVQATTPDAGPGTVEMVAGGQRGRYAAHELVGRDDAIAAAVHFLHHQTPAQTVSWVTL